MKKTLTALVLILLHVNALVADPPSATRTAVAMEKAAVYFRNEVASHGGYVYFYSLDRQQRWGEGVATKDQIWVQPPATPTVGIAYLRAYEATGDKFYLNAATDAANALIHGQLQSGGWTNCVDFDSKGSRVAQYRNGKGRGKNNSSLDDGQTQSAIRLLVQVDGAHRFENKAIHEASMIALDALLDAQFPCGAFPQVWDGDETVRPKPKRANYPEYDWRVEGRIKNYWDMYTINDNVTGYVAEALIDAHRIYGDEKYLGALRRLGDFLILAQLPSPQPGWAQQYNYEMQPIWARKFEPPGVSGDETQETIATLIKISRITGDDKYLRPIPAAIDYLKRSLLPDGKLARYYELKTNKPLYMTRTGDRYDLTYSDANLPKHYGWKTSSRIDELETAYQTQKAGRTMPKKPITSQQTERLVANLDGRGRWVSTYRGERLVGQAKMKLGEKYLSSEVFSNHLATLSRFLRQR